MRYREALREMESRMKKAGIEDAVTDAWYLLEHVMKHAGYENFDRSRYLLHSEEEMEASVQSACEELVQKRLQRIPLQHLTGEQEFFGYPFYVNAHVLIPRQDTEILVEEALKIARDRMDILDLCTGCGCILLSILKRVPPANGVGADLSGEALKVAQKNAARLGVKAEFLQSDLFEAVEGQFDMIVSNPPYIPTKDIEGLMPEVRDHEPRMALDGMEDGLYYYREIVRQSPAYLKKGGRLLLEIGYDQGEAVRGLLCGAGFENVRVVKDLGELDRVVLGTWQ